MPATASTRKTSQSVVPSNKKENVSSTEHSKAQSTINTDRSADQPKVSTQPSEVSSHPSDKKIDDKASLEQLPHKRKSRVWQIIVVILLLVLLVAGSAAAVIGYYTLTRFQTLETQAQTMLGTGREAYQAIKDQNLPEVKAKLDVVSTQLNDTKVTYDQLGFWSQVPFAGQYYRDGQQAFVAARAGLDAAQLSIDTIEPFAVDLGFAGEGTFEGGTAENRVQLILETLEKVTPQLDEITDHLETANQAVAQIDESLYPEEFQGRAIRSNITQAKSVLDDATTLFTDYRPIIEQLPEIAGATGERKKYLILFQNDGELRPTGGFMTAYAVIFMENGVVTPEKSDDIYELDQKFTQRIEIPNALGRYLTTERFWNLRDMNISPDFKTSMETFYKNYQTVRGEPDNIDGIIAVDTHLLTKLIEIVGPITIPGYGTFSAENDSRCDCPQIIYALSEIITRPTPFIREDRKGILAPLMKAVIERIYASPRAFMAELFTTGLESVEGRHLQAYLFDSKQQQAIENINAAGLLTPKVDGADFLAIINANLGGAKSNFFTTYNVEQVVSAPENGQITKAVTITYRNNRPADNCNLEAGLLCLNSTLQDWTRLYVPQGSELVQAQGFTEEPQVYEEAGFTVFDGFFVLEPSSQATLRLTYTVPYENTNTYTVELWKQGGIDPIPVLFDVTGGQEEVVVSSDTVYETKF